MTNHAAFTVSITGADRVGLLARICDALQREDCRLADAQITRLGGRFTALVVVRPAGEMTEQELSDGLEDLRDEETRVRVCTVGEDVVIRHAPRMRPYLVSYEGGDRPGLLHALAHAMSKKGCQFVDVSIEVGLGKEETAVVLVCEIDAPRDMPQAEIEAAAREVGEQYWTELAVIPADMDDLPGR